MKCKNCGQPKEAHVPVPGPHGRTLFQCPNGSGDTYPATADVKIDLHFRPGENNPWVVTWVHPETGQGGVTAADPVAALQAAGHAIEHQLEEKSPAQVAIEQAIKR